MFRFLRSVKSQIFFMLLIFSVLIVGTLTITLTISLDSMRAETRNVLKTSAYQHYDTMIKAQVQQAISAMDIEWKQRTNDAEGTESCRNLLRSLRYLDDHSGYFWADTVGGLNVVHGSKPELEGKNRIDSVDSHSFKLIREIIRVGQISGGGFTNYWLTKDSDKQHEYPKRGYSVTFKPLNWIVGTGNYTDTIDKEITLAAAKLEGKFSQLQLDTISRVSLILLILFFTLFVFSLRILDLIRKLNEALFELTQVGTDLKVNLPLKGPTELVDAAKHFNEFIGAVRDILTSFARDANAIGAANEAIYVKLGNLSENLGQVSVRMRALLKEMAQRPTTNASEAESLRNMAKVIDQSVEMTESIAKDARKRNEVYANTTGELIRFKLDN